MDVFRSRMHVVVRARKEQEAAARAIDEARTDVGGVAGESNDDIANPHGFDYLLNVVFEEAVYDLGLTDSDLGLITCRLTWARAGRASASA